MFWKICTVLWWLETRLIAVLLLAMSSLVFAQVLTRYVFMYSVPWIEELTRFLMIWMVLLGAAAAVKQKQHIVIDLVDVVVKNKHLIACWHIGLCAAGIAFSAAMTVLACTVVARTAMYGQVSGAMRIPMYLANGSFLVASVLMIVHYMEILCTAFESGREKSTIHSRQSP